MYFTDGTDRRVSKAETLRYPLPGCWRNLAGGAGDPGPLNQAIKRVVLVNHRSRALVRVVLGHALALAVKIPELVLRFGVTLLSRIAVPRCRLALCVTRHISKLLGECKFDSSDFPR